MRISVEAETFQLAEVFTISRSSRTAADVLVVAIEDQGHVGRGECVPYKRYGETLETVAEQIFALQDNRLTRSLVQSALPAGAARNAVDCALWDLEAKQAGTSVWQLASLQSPDPQITAFTLSLGTPEAMQAAAARHAHRPLLKTKLGGGHEDIERIKAVRAGAPNTDIIVDANEGWSVADYQALAPVFTRLGVKMVEQPFPANQDDALAEIARPLPVCADESCHTREGLKSLLGKYDMINIKLDKTGGLTEALALRQEAEALGFRIMVGCMVGSSLAMAPAVLVAQGVDIVDLDGPLLLAEDWDPPLIYDERGVHPAKPQLWG